MHGKDGDRSPPLRQYPTELVIPPATQDGVARALREAFATPDKDLPADWRGLLDRIH